VSTVRWWSDTDEDGGSPVSVPTPSRGSFVQPLRDRGCQRGSSSVSTSAEVYWRSSRSSLSDRIVSVKPDRANSAYSTVRAEPCHRTSGATALRSSNSFVPTARSVHLHSPKRSVSDCGARPTTLASSPTCRRRTCHYMNMYGRRSERRGETEREPRGLTFRDDSPAWAADEFRDPALTERRRPRHRGNFQVYTPICTPISAVVSGSHPGETRMYAGVHLARDPQVSPWAVVGVVVAPGGSLSAVVATEKLAVSAPLTSVSETRVGSGRPTSARIPAIRDRQIGRYTPPTRCVQALARYRTIGRWPADGRSPSETGIARYGGIYCRYVPFHPKREVVGFGARVGMWVSRPKRDVQTGHTAGRSTGVHADVRNSHPVYTAESRFRRVYDRCGPMGFNSNYSRKKTPTARAVLAGSGPQSVRDSRELQPGWREKS